MKGTTPVMTYILECSNGEFYCGKTNNIKRRLEEHKKEKYPHWFCNEKRKDFKLKYLFNGDIEKIIKTMKIKNLINVIERRVLYP